MRSCYVAGPMRSKKWLNFPAFDKARDLLIEQGYKVISPADLDRECGFDATKLPEDTDWNLIPKDFSLEECVKRDVEAVMGCDCIFMLPGWEYSTGAKAEKALAEWLGKEILYSESFQLPLMRNSAILKA